VTDGGVELARRQLRDLVEIADGAIELLSEWTNVHGNQAFTISLDTTGTVHGETGIKVRDRERFKVIISPDFPFVLPSVHSAHSRWARTPHVQWGTSLCLYAATSVEWDPADGMRGLIGRLSQWVARAAAGTLDPDGQPLHPPAVYTSTENGTVVIHPDLGPRVPWATTAAQGTVVTAAAWCRVDSANRRIDVEAWTDLQTANEHADDEEAAVFIDGHPLIVLPVVLMAEEFGFEYPTDVKALSAGLAESGYSRDNLIADLCTATGINRKLRDRQVAQDRAAAGTPWDFEEGDEGQSLLTAMLVGTPSRRLAGETRLAHLAGWRLDNLSSSLTNLIVRASNVGRGDIADDVRDIADRWFESAKISWMRVMETRPEVTQRRDQTTPATWVHDKRILVLGCGALGAPVAEHCVRAGAAAVTVADNGVVHPGILLRQPYDDADIGRPKAIVLSERLTRIGLAPVVPSVGNAREEFFRPGIDLTGFDLVIDATADASVRAGIELHRKDAAFRLPLVTMVIGHQADLGLVTTALPSATGAAADAFRKVSLLASSGEEDWVDVGEDLFPAEPRTELFFPEPGCSSPTFVGSSAQSAALAGMMLHEAFAALQEATNTTPPGEEPQVTFASAVRLGSASTRGTSRASWAADTVQVDQSGAYEVRVTASALAVARDEVRHGADLRGAAVETGGMLLGAFDDAIGVVYVDTVAGPPPDSYLAERYFQHGLEGAQERVDLESKRTGRTLGFVGFWHSHPYGPAYPSNTDEQGMAMIVAPDGTTRRALMMILGGNKARWDAWRDAHATARPDLYLRVVPRSAAAQQPGPARVVVYIGGLDLQRLPPGSYFRGTGKKRVQVGGTGPALGPVRSGPRRWLLPWKRA